MLEKETSDPKFHHFSQSIANIVLPEKFTYPFHYIPHPLCKLAAAEVQAYLNTQSQWQQELQAGKMFGILIVRHTSGQIGYLAAFSGMLDNRNLHAYFVPPIYDLQEPNGFFKAEETKISALNTRIALLERNNHYLKCKRTLSMAQNMAQEVLEKARDIMAFARQQRELCRQNNPSQTELALLQRESQHQKASLKRLKQHWTSRIVLLENEVNKYKVQIEQLKTERKKRSLLLQQQLFKQFKILNAWKEEKDLCVLFKENGREMPPAGAGECAAPKLLQYAYHNGLYPLAMAEFWWGHSPKSEIRRQGYYYPACKEKCEPILKHMLQGLEVEANPLFTSSSRQAEILYEDEWLAVVNKPAGLLSVPGKSDQPSVYQQFKQRYPNATGPLLVHRLDMATSGLLLIAKTQEIHKILQAQFCQRTIKKRYIALLDGKPAMSSGIIALPLCPNPHDRPRQIVNDEYGKPAITQYQVLTYGESCTLIAFYPLTGRTHQLRVHAAHPLGLNVPIMGDELYGKPADRLYLHAEFLEFRHPVTGKTIHIEAPVPAEFKLKVSQQ